jgi:hypothetical protein
MLAARAMKGTQERVVREDDKWLGTNTSNGGSSMASEQSVASLMDLIVHGTLAAASGAKFVHQGLGAGIGAAQKLARQVSNPRPPKVDEGLVPIVEQMASDTRKGVYLLFDLVSLAAKAVATVFEGTALPPEKYPLPGPTKIAILGGGVAGMSAAQELAERGFEVEVYEHLAVPGGKARQRHQAEHQDRRTRRPSRGAWLPLFPRILPKHHRYDETYSVPESCWAARAGHVVDNLVAAKEVGFASRIASCYSLRQSARDRGRICRTQLQA